MDEYNEKNCDERHDNIEKELVQVWKRIDKFDARIWVIIGLQLIILGSIIGALVKFTV